MQLFQNKTGLRLLRKLNKQAVFFSHSSQQETPKHQDLIQNYRHINSFGDRMTLTFKMALNSYLQPQNGTFLSELGCLSSDYALRDIWSRMKQDKEGQLILKEQPRVNSGTAPIDYLLSLDKESFGYAYGRFMGDRSFKSEDRPKSKYIQDLELAYVYQRYKEIHDFIHALLGYDVTTRDEIIVKWFEMEQLKLPSAAMSAIVAPLKLNNEDRCDMMTNHIPQIIQNARSGRFVMNIYFEKHFERNLAEFRKELGIRPNPLRNLL